MRRGLFVTFEGIDGSGKTTQIDLLRRFLEQQGQTCLLTREPGGTEGAEAVRSLLKKNEFQWHGLSELFLLLAARHDHVTKKIEPALNKGVCVLCDRFTDSTDVYQGHFLKDLTPQALHQICTYAAGQIVPHITFILDIDPVLVQKRIKERRHDGICDRYDALCVQEMSCLRERFIALAHRESARCHVIQAGLPVDAVHHAIVKKMQECYEEYRKPVGLPSHS